MRISRSRRSWYWSSHGIGKRPSREAGPLAPFNWPTIAEQTETTYEAVLSQDASAKLQKSIWATYRGHTGISPGSG